MTCLSTSIQSQILTYLAEARILYLEYFWYAEFDGHVDVTIEIPYLNKIAVKNQYCQFKLKFGIQTRLVLTCQIQLWYWVDNVGQFIYFQQKFNLSPNN